MKWSYESLRAAVEGISLPCVLVDEEKLLANAERLFSIAAGKGKRLRVATKSVRVPAVLERIASVGGARQAGWMCYSAREARFLASLGLDDFLVAYPVMDSEEIGAMRSLVQENRRVSLVVDSEAQLEAISKSGGPPVSVVVDVDVSYRKGGAHLGVRRSPIRSLGALESLCARIAQTSGVRLAGVMAYEAQVAGLADRNPAAPWLNPIKSAIKRLSIPDVRRRREEIANWAKRAGVTLEIFNGGGTGSLASTALEPWITEVTAGSGFLQPALFDYYASNRCEPAYCFALRVTRSPEPGVVTCQSGGFIASGEVSVDKCPVPILPTGLESFSAEGFGEVQTPLRDRSGELKPGDPVFFRPAKAGEIAERFSEYWIVGKDGRKSRVPTYRGMGQVFF